MEASKNVSGFEEKPRLWTLNYVLVCLSTLSLMIGFAALFPTLPIYVEEYGNMSGVSGLPLAALTLGAVLTRPIAGWGLDIYGRKPFLFLGLLFFLIPTALYISMLPVIFLIILRFIQGTAFGFGNTALSTTATDLVPLKRMGEGMSIYTVTISMALAIGPPLGLWLIDTYNFPALFISVMVLTLISFLLLLLVKFKPYERRRLQKRPKLVFMNKKCIKQAVVVLLVTINYSAAINFIALHASNQGIANPGIYFTSLAITLLLTRSFAGRILDAKGLPGFNLSVFIGGASIILSMLLVSQVGSTNSLIGSGILYGFGFGLVQPAMLVLCIKNLPLEKSGAANATYWTAYDLGVVIGSTIWGLVSSLVGYSNMYILSVIPVVAGLIYYYFKRPHTIPQH